VGTIDGEIAGIAACTDKINNQCVKCNGKIFIQSFGIVKGIIANIVFKQMFQKGSNELEDETASIEFIATSSKYRGKGIATSIIKHICSLNNYKKFVITDVADSNHTAIKVYEKAGFKEYKRVKKNYKKVGINAYISFKYCKKNVTIQPFLESK
jgi:ribosomal protein S18 acetylase RimI-like enzyme